MTILIIQLISGIILPIVFFIITKKLYGCKPVPVIAGALAMLTGALILEQLLHTIVLTSPVGATIQNTLWLYGLYGALCAATFEEVARFITMKYILKKYHDNDNTSVMYGLGHGGFECFYLLVVGAISSIALLIAANAGTLDQVTQGLDPAAAAKIAEQIAALESTSVVMAFVAVIERVSAIVAQMVMSVFMWQAAAKGKKIFFLVAFVFHFVVDFSAVMLGSVSIAATEILIAVVAVVGWLIARRFVHPL